MVQTEIKAKVYSENEKSIDNLPVYLMSKF